MVKKLLINFALCFFRKFNAQISKKLKFLIFDSLKKPHINKIVNNIKKFDVLELLKSVIV